jgi:DNA-binding NarL/FixJ family response regulator
MAKPITIVTIDDHALIREAIKGMIATREDMLLVGEGWAGEQLFALVEEHQPDVLILDLNMPQSANKENNKRFAAIEALVRLHEEFKETAVIILSQHATLPFVQAAIENDVRSYLLKNDDLSLNLLDAIEAVHKGGTLFSREINNMLFGQTQANGQTFNLTERQIEVIQSLAKWPGKSYTQLAAELHISTSTFKGHLNKVFKELDVPTATACVIKAMQLGLIPFHLDDRGLVVFDLS